MASALERQCRENAILPADRDRALGALRRDLRSSIIVELTADVIDLALGILARHTLRTGDAVQLASAMELGNRLDYPVGFSAFDKRLLEAARKEGIPVLN